MERAEPSHEYAVATATFADRTSLEVLQELLKRVREFLRMDIAFVAEFVDGRQIFRQVDSQQASRHLVMVGESNSLEGSYCQRAIDGRLPRVIPDTQKVKEARDLPATQALRIGCYLVAPIVLPDGVIYGTLCCFSHQPKEKLEQSEIDALQAVAKLVAQAVAQDRGLPTLPH